MDQHELKIAVVGLGKMGLLHASILNAMPNVRIAALVDKSTMMTKIFKKIFAKRDIKVLSEVQNLAGLGLDAVYITTPISSHSFIANTLYTKRITTNLFIEKTLSPNYENSKGLCAFAKEYGGTNMVGYMKRFSVVFAKAKELLNQNTLGEPKSFKAYAYSSDFLGLTKESKSSASRGGALRDIGCHVIDLTLWMLGNLEFQDIDSASKTGIGAETSISFTARNSKGQEGQFDISQQMPNYRMPEFGLQIECTKGKLEVNDDRLLLTSSNGELTQLYKHNLNDHVDFFLGESEYFRENQHFVTSILNKTQCESNFESASKVDHIIEQVKNKVSANGQ